MGLRCVPRIYASDRRIFWSPQLLPHTSEIFPPASAPGLLRHTKFSPSMSVAKVAGGESFTSWEDRWMVYLNTLLFILGLWFHISAPNPSSYLYLHHPHSTTHLLSMPFYFYFCFHSCFDSCNYNRFYSLLSSTSFSKLTLMLHFYLYLRFYNIVYCLHYSFQHLLRTELLRLNRSDFHDHE